MVEVGVVLHQIAVRVPIHVRRPGHEVAGHDGDLHAQGDEIVLHVLVEGAVHPRAELHPVRVAGRAFGCVPVAHGFAHGLIEAALDAAHGPLCGILVLAQRADALVGPGLFHLLAAMVLHQQKVPEAAGNLVPIGLHLLARVRAGVPLDGALLVVHLHGHDRRIVLEGKAGVGVHMAEQLPGVFLLQLDEPCVVHGVALHAGGDGAGVLQTVALEKGPGHDQVDVQVDALFLELGKEIVETVQPLGIEDAGGALVIVQQRGLPAAGPVAGALPDGSVGCVEADHVHAHAGKARGQLFRVLVGRSVGAGCNVEAQEAGALAVLKSKVAILHAHEAMAARRGVQQMGKIQCAAVRLYGGNTDVLFHGCSSSGRFVLFLSLLYQKRWLSYCKITPGIVNSRLFFLLQRFIL